MRWTTSAIASDMLFTYYPDQVAEANASMIGRNVVFSDIRARHGALVARAPFSAELKLGLRMPIPPALGGSQLAVVMFLNQQQDFLQDVAIVAKAFYCDPVVRDRFPCTVRTTGGASEVSRILIEVG